MDFMHDTLCSGRGFRTLNMVDCFSREALAVEVGTSLTGKRFVRVLQRLLETRGKPEVIQVDNGSEFTGAALDRVRLFGTSRCCTGQSESHEIGEDEDKADVMFDAQISV